MSIQRLFTQFDDHLRKIEQKIKNENYKSLDSPEKNLFELNVLLKDSGRIVISNFLYRKN